MAKTETVYEEELHGDSKSAEGESAELLAEEDLVSKFVDLVVGP